MTYSPFKMKGHTLPGIKQKSPAKHPHTETKSHGTHGHNTDTGKSVAEGGVAKPGNPNYVPPKKESPAKQTYDKSGTDERVYDIDQNKYDSWRQGIGKKRNAPDIRYLGAKENKKHLEGYLNRQKPIPKDPRRKIKLEKAPRALAPTVQAPVYEKSPAKIAPLIAMAGKAIIGSLASKAVNSMTKKEDE